MKIHLDIVAGQKTCASEPGVSRMGTRTRCQIFDTADIKVPSSLGNTQEDGTGWVLRHPACIDAQVGE